MSKKLNKHEARYRERQRQKHFAVSKEKLAQKAADQIAAEIQKAFDPAPDPGKWMSDISKKLSETFSKEIVHAFNRESVFHKMLKSQLDLLSESSDESEESTPGDRTSR